MFELAEPTCLDKLLTIGSSKQPVQVKEMKELKYSCDNDYCCFLRETKLCIITDQQLFLSQIIPDSMQPSGRCWVLVGMVGRFCRHWADVGPTPFSALAFPAISTIVYMP